MTPAFFSRPKVPIEWDVCSTAFDLHWFFQMAIPFRFRTEPLALSKARFQAVGNRECNDQASLHIWHPAVSWDSRKVRVGRQVLSVALASSSPCILNTLKPSRVWVFEASSFGKKGIFWVRDSLWSHWSWRHDCASCRPSLKVISLFRPGKTFCQPYGCTALHDAQPAYRILAIQTCVLNELDLGYSLGHRGSERIVERS